MDRDFSQWISGFRQSIASYEYYVNFEKAMANTVIIKAKLNLYNALVGSTNIEEDFKQLISEFPSALEVVPLLLAVRQSQIMARDEQNGDVLYDFKNQSNPIEDYCYFMRETGLFHLFETGLIGNVYDYAVGVEVGLDSNGRKNRGGHLMEDLVESHIRALNIAYDKEITATAIECKYNVDLSKITNEGSTTKRWDFAFEHNGVVYLIETNFYASSGSKLNETARSYKMIASEVDETEGVKFVWVTDGVGWLQARNNLKETFDILETIYSIADLERGALNSLIEES